jgi:protein-disulfide isomerase
MQRTWMIGAAAAVVVAVAAVGYLQSDGRSIATEVAPMAHAATGSKDPAAGLAVTADDHVLGKKDAPITIIEYASLTCPHCAAFEHETLPKIEKDWIDTGKAKLVFRNFPFDQAALRAAMLAECAGPEKYFNFLNALFGSQETWARASDPSAALIRIGKLGGLSEERVQACFKDESLANKLVATRMTAEKDLDVNSTPTFFVNGKKIVGAQPYEAFEQALDAAARKS